MDTNIGRLAAERRETPASKTGAPICQLGGDNGEDSIGAQTRQPPFEPLSPIDFHLPCIGMQERALRVRIHKARDLSQARASRSKHGRARVLYWVAAQLSSDWVFARGATDDDLNEILAALSLLFIVAGKIERLEAPDE
jgi:hypothetical protein